MELVRWPSGDPATTFLISSYYSRVASLATSRLQLPGVLHLDSVEIDNDMLAE